MNNWKETTLGEVAKVQTGPFGSQLHEEDYVPDGTPIITVENLVNDYINHSADTPRVSDEDKTRLARYTLSEGDIVFSRVGSVDRCGYVSAKEDGWLFSGRLLRVRPARNLFNKYVFYWISQPSIKEYVRKIAVGATMPSINTDLLSQVPISFPLLPEQKAIAAVLSSFDDKIELLRRQNKTLESIAQTTFKEWFVKFKVKGEKLKVNSKTGLPEGWRMGKLGDIAHNVRQGVSVNNLQDHKYYVGLEHIERKHLALYNWGYADKVESNKSLFAKGDILFGKLRAYFHKVCFAPIEGVCSTDILVLRPKKPDHFTFCLCYFFSEDVVKYSDSSSTGTRMPRTSWDILSTEVLNG